MKQFYGDYDYCWGPGGSMSQVVVGPWWLNELGSCRGPWWLNELGSCRALVAQ